MSRQFQIIQCLNKPRRERGNYHPHFYLTQRLIAGCIIVLEVFYRTDFSLLGFLICSSILGLGMFEATSLDRTRRGLVHAENVFTEDFDTSLTRNPLPS